MDGYRYIAYRANPAPSTHHFHVHRYAAIGQKAIMRITFHLGIVVALLTRLRKHRPSSTQATRFTAAKPLRYWPIVAGTPKYVAFIDCMLSCALKLPSCMEEQAPCRAYTTTTTFFQINSKRKKDNVRCVLCDARVHNQWKHSCVCVCVMCVSFGKLTAVIVLFFVHNS